MDWWDSLIDAVSDVSGTAAGIYTDWTSTDASTANNTQTPAANDTGNHYVPTNTTGAHVPAWAMVGGGLLLVVIVILALRGGK